MGDISKQNSTGQNRRAAQEATQQDHNKRHLAHGIIGKIREKQEGSGSLEKESPVCIVAIEKEEKTRFVHQHRLGKRQCHAHKAGQALTQRVIPALHMGRFSRLFSYSCVLLGRRSPPCKLPRRRFSNAPDDRGLECSPTSAGSSVYSYPQWHSQPLDASCGRGQSTSRSRWLF